MREKTQHYLLFDSSCALCSDLAADIERASGGALLGMSLYAREAKELLDRARPNWKFEPTLLQVKGEEVRAYTGMAMRTRMLTFLNPLQLIKIGRLVQQAGVPLFGSIEPKEPHPRTTKAAEPGAERETTKATFAPGFRLTHDGPAIGAETPIRILTTTTGKDIPLANGGERNTILLFISTSCPYCKQVAEYVAAFAESAPEQVVLVFSTVEPEKLREFISQYHLGALPIVISPEARGAFHVTGVPYAYALDGKGIVRGKGIVNNGEHLDSLANTFYVSVEAFKQALASRQQDSAVVS